MNAIGTILSPATYLKEQSSNGAFGASKKDFSEQASKGFFLFLDYEKATDESVATYLPMEYYQQVQDIYSHYHSTKDHPFQFTLESAVIRQESVEYMVKGVSYMRNQRVEFVQCLGDLALPSEFTNLTLDTDTTNAMMTLLSRGGIARYVEQVVKGVRLAELVF